MAHPTTGDEKRAYVRGMFGRVARRYDLMNRLMTLGLDRRWREMAVRLAQPPSDGRALDVGVGTGDLSIIMAREMPLGIVVGVDYTHEIMEIARYRAASEVPNRWVYFVEGDALQLPFADGCFNAVVTGFLVRNVTDIHAAFSEMYRVTNLGGRVACLEASRSESRFVRFMHRYVIRYVLTALGGVISGDLKAYSYFHSTSLAFHSREALAEIMREAGWTVESIHPLFFGSVAIHVGVKTGTTLDEH